MIPDLYQEVVKEHFDVTDNTTRKTMLCITESEKSQVLGALANKLYSKIVKDVTNIDYGTIPLTKGDITKMENYLDLLETLQTVRDIQVEFKQSTDEVDTVLLAIENTKKYKALWIKAFGIDCEFVEVLYNNICMAIVGATAIIVSTSIEYIKDPNEGTFNAVLTRVSKNQSGKALMLRNLKRFNDSCAKGDLEKACKDLLSYNTSLKEQAALLESEQECLQELAPSSLALSSITPAVPATIVAITSLIVVLKCFIPFLRELTVTFLNAKQSFSDYLAIESDIVRLNAEKVQYTSAKSDEAKKKIRNKQLKIADRLKKMSDVLAVKMTKAAKIAEAEVKQDKSEKVKIDDVVDTLPDSVASLF